MQTIQTVRAVTLYCVLLCLEGVVKRMNEMHNEKNYANDGMNEVNE